jgi:hypothetical protein
VAGPVSSTRTVGRIVATLLALTLTAGSCDEEQALPILVVELTDPDVITATITCVDALRTLVDESSADVRIRLRGTARPGEGQRCTVEVPLDDSLGDRLVVDGRDGRAWRYVEDELKMVRLAGCKETACEVDWSIDDDANACDAASFLLASIGAVVGARGDSTVSVRRCSARIAVTAIDGTPYVWGRSVETWFVLSTLADACAFRTDAAPVTDADCALVDSP